MNRWTQESNIYPGPLITSKVKRSYEPPTHMLLKTNMYQLGIS